ncbi:MFS transporter [Helicobacter turcicus]|uniref:MFS transporter n=1 Tax=Helicobacter turcicus TaxID=2867412 RepID=A0ABS7JN40_9HELI|nr:MFS transporter [Helicobacter turcicus]MBX7490818.1 MFS transporter [Helicobacter turcicus]MBX7545573.1 MFS transporter [Helicobacter turcicus]
MKNYTLLVVMLSAIVTISSIYITQPIHPLFAEIFGISIAQVTLFTSVVLLALAFAPIVYGYLLEKFDTRLILTTALTYIGILQCLLCFSQDYTTFLILRILEALMIPAALTAALTTLTRLDSKNIQKNISIYVASTVFGGALSRIGSGLITSLFSWQTTFALLGVTTLSVAFMSYYLPKSDKLNSAKITPKIFIDFLKDKRYALLYMGAFLVLFCFQGALNLMPFEIKAINPNISSAEIGFLYTGYIIGIITALLASYITKIAKGALNAIILGFIIFGVAPLLMLIKGFWWMFFAVFVICIGMFIAHSVLSGFINNIQKEKKGITNGLYLAFYYTGGTCGTTLPSYLYEAFGWEVLCFVLSGILFGSAWLFYAYRGIFKGV